jgi:hypothetical protein
VDREGSDARSRGYTIEVGRSSARLTADYGAVSEIKQLPRPAYGSWPRVRRPT